MIPRFPNTEELQVPQVDLWCYKQATEMYSAFNARFECIKKLLELLHSWGFAEGEYPTIYISAQPTKTYEMVLWVGINKKDLEDIPKESIKNSKLENLTLAEGLYAVSMVSPVGQLVHAHEALYAEWILKDKQIYDESRQSYETLNNYFLDKSGFDLYVPIK